GDRACRRQTQGGNGVRELAGSVRRLGVAPRQGEFELDDTEAVGLAAEVLRQEPLRLRPVRRQLAGRSVPNADPVAELDLGAERDADERRERGVRVSLAKERRLELRVCAVERLVVPVE